MSTMLSAYEALSRPDLEAIQSRRVRALLTRAYRDSSFYRTKIDEAGVSPERIADLAAFRERVPFSTKAELLADQDRHPPFGSRLCVDRRDVALINLTGGTSGQGQETYGRTQADVQTLGYLHALAWYRAGLRPDHTVLNCVPTGGMTTGGWGPSEGIRIIGATGLTPPAALSTEAKIDLMLRFRPLHFIYASTNYLHRMTEVMGQLGIVPREAFPDLVGVFIAAEGYPLEWARRIQDLWGCTLHEGYGSTQCVGFAAGTGPQGAIGPDGGRGVMELFEWMTLCEVIDPESGQAVAPGEEGELVVTNLTIEASPVIRFRTGDRVRFVPAADRASALNAIECGGIGRYDDMMKIRGNNVWPDAVDAAVLAFAEVDEYVGRVFTADDGKTDVEIRVALKAAAAACSEAERGRIAGALRDAVKERTNVAMRVVFADRAELPEYTYKARRWSDERQKGYRL
ncbi:phenylacetate--CoA ligase family protein [Oceanibacterium hippocampi]|uniref:Phenylacetate-coenzyme A ligase n=1 Tax=Oceanibacterium hippocampi TaxID=745714 RepID=A0A1Y5TSS6_9PROT|nr:AMP-binding protein [Oceanibacterium hippocampi]SLN70579.1 Phenylacetate-coenzyme A ligase [Oceanibacterium hippocampi]